MTIARLLVACYSAASVAGDDIGWTHDDAAAAVAGIEQHG